MYRLLLTFVSIRTIVISPFEMKLLFSHLLYY